MDRVGYYTMRLGYTLYIRDWGQRNKRIMNMDGTFEQGWQCDQQVQGHNECIMAPFPIML